MPSIGKRFRDLKRRCVTRAVTTYTLALWVVVQLGDVGFPLLEVPGWVLEVIVIVGLTGLPLVLLASWFLTKATTLASESRTGEELLASSTVVFILVATGALIGLIAYQVLQQT